METGSVYGAPIWGNLFAMNYRPNFNFIVADDLGSAGLDCYGGSGAAYDVSPNIDHMAREGLRFTHALANSPVCSPTRFALLTGRYQYRFRGAAEEPLGSSERGSSVLGLLLGCKKPKLRAPNP